ncbi:MAG: hypothetical protein HUJ78_06315, partial [Mogibacterium sp.]|nr:hypothetical protein [Mogibacterium sp.]
MTNLERKIRIALVLLIVAINVVTIGVVVANRGEYQINLVDPGENITSVDVEIEDEKVAELTGQYRKGRFLVLDFHAVGEGQTQVMIDVHDQRGAEEEYTFYNRFKTNKLGMLIVRKARADFNGWHILWMSFILTMILVAMMLLVTFVRGLRTNLYSYKTSQTGGVMIFLFGLSLLNIAVSLVVIPNYRLYTADTVWAYVCTAFFFFMVAATPFVVGFGAALSISNV